LRSSKNGVVAAHHMNYSALWIMCIFGTPLDF